MLHRLDIFGVSVASAAPVAVTPIVATDFTGISWLSFFIALLVAGLAGLTKYFIDLGKQGQDSVPISSGVTYVLSGMLAGLFVYLITSYMALHPNLVLFTLGFAGYSGETVLNMGPIKWLTNVLNNFNKTS